LFSPGYLLMFLLVAGVLGLAGAHVKRTYRRWAGVRNSSGLTGAQIAKQLLAVAGLAHIQVEIIDGELTDNYDPTQKVLRLSQGTAYNASVASEGIVAHEIGHAMQDARAFAPMRLRSAIVPAANIGSQAGPMIIILGLILMAFTGRGATGTGFNLGFDVALIGLALFASILVFHLVTFPVELDASRRAMALLRQSGILTPADLTGARKVLTAAALTYFAAIAASAIQVAYWGMQVFGRRD
jgi:hypothetical protein